MSYLPYSCTASAKEEIVEEIIQTTTGFLSVIGSTYIVVDVLKQLCKNKHSSSVTARSDPYQRIMLALSFFDILHSFFDSFMGTWMTPSETGWLMAVGNQASCTTQGFFTAVGFMGSFCYQMALSLNIFVLIVFGWSQEKFARTIEKPMHVVMIITALVYGIIPLPMQGYNADCGQCLWAQGLPSTNRGSATLTKNYWDTFWAMIIIMLIVCTVSMIWVLFSVWKKEFKSSKYRYSSDETNFRESKRIRKILLLYTMALYLCWGFPFTTIRVAIWLKRWPSYFPFGFRALCETLIPLLGFFNMLVYFMPKCLRYQREHPNICLIHAYCHVLLPSSVLSCCKKSLCFGYNNDNNGNNNYTEDTTGDMNFAKYNNNNKNNAANNKTISSTKMMSKEEEEDVTCMERMNNKSVQDLNDDEEMKMPDSGDNEITKNLE